MNEALIVIFGVAVTAIVGLFVLTRDIRSLSSRLYGLMTLAFITLMTANLFTYGDLTDEYSMLWCIRIVAVSTVVAFTSLYFLTQTLALEAKMPRFDKRLSKAIFWVSCLTILSTVSPLAFSGLTLTESNVAQVQVSWGVIPFIVLVLGLMILTVFHLIRGTRGVSAKLRAQNISILAGLLPALLLAPVTSFMLPVVYHLTWFVGLSPFYIIFFVMMVAYAMIRYGLFDVRLAAVRTAAYVLTILSMASLYIVIVYSVSDLILQNQASVTASLLNPVAIGSALLVGFSFQPMRKLFNKLTDGLFYKDNYSVGDFITRLSRVLNTTNDLRKLLERTSRIIASTLRSSQAFFVVRLPNDRYITAGLEDHAKVTLTEFSAFENPVHLSQEMILLSNLAVDDPARKMMVSNKLHLVMPLRKKDVIVGYLCLGEPQNIRYTTRDTRALAAISDELIIAIENALSVEEVRRLNDTLEQRISSATKELRASNAQLQRLDETKDEFISMASHQLRTPLTSIKGYLSMLIEGDVGEVTKEQKHVLNEAFVSSERMVRLIGDFLNVSRLQTGKFVIEKHPVDLALLVQREIDGLESNAAARGMKFVYAMPKNIPMLQLDENKIQQVVMNFSDNAIYYSKENATIKVVLKKIPGFVEFKVIDSGIGVPAAEQENLFGKFFRATNARKQRPDGTGVGLFLAKKVVDAHGGEIIFESKEKKGSTFGFRLPLSK